MNDVSATAQTDNRKNILTIIYVLYALGLLTSGTTMIVGFIIALIKRSDYGDGLHGDHLRWLVNTFWIALVGGIVGALSAFIFVGIFILVATWVWCLYRIIKGYLRFNENKSPYNSVAAVSAA